MVLTSVHFHSKAGRQFYLKLVSNTPLAITCPMSPRAVIRSSKLLLPASKPYICPTCRDARSFSNVASRKNTKSLDVRRFLRPQSRSASTVTPVTTVRPLPQTEEAEEPTDQFRDLRHALKKLLAPGSPFVDQSILRKCIVFLTYEPGLDRNVIIAGEDCSTNKLYFIEFD